MTEEEVKLNYITPAIEKAGWNKNLIRMEYPITAGKIVVRGDKAFRLTKKRADYLLFYKENLPLAIVEAKDNSHIVGDGMLQAQEYAKKLDVRFVYTSNGDGFLFYDMETGEQEKLSLDEFPAPQTLYDLQYKKQIAESKDLETIINTPYYFGEESFPPRYYQRIAINRTVEAIASGKDRVLLVMATGTGKTYMAFQIIWRLWKSGLKKRILYLADRNILVDQTIIGDFKPFKNSMTKIYHKNMNTSYEIYLSLYQQLSENDTEDNLALLKESFKPDFFDLIIVDECHRGSARDDSNWRKVLDYFSSASKIGMTATPKETKEISNIDYFGEPIYTYSLKDGIEDGFLAPYKVIRYAIDTDVYGYRPTRGKTDITGELVEDREYKEVMYYSCSRNKQSRGRHCDYSANLKKTDIEPLVVEVIKKLVQEEEFAVEIKRRIGAQVDTDKIDTELFNYENKLKEVEANKSRLECEIDTLPLGAAHRDRKILDMTTRLDALYDNIAEIESNIEDARFRKKAAEEKALTLENIYKILMHFSELYDIMNDEERKELLAELIQEIQIYPEGESDCPLKSIKFNFPVFQNGKETEEVFLNKPLNVETLKVWRWRNFFSNYR